MESWIIIVWCVSHAVMPNYLWPRGLWLTRILCPCNFSSQNTGVGAIPFWMRSSWPSDWTLVSHNAGRFFTIWATRKAIIKDNIWGQIGFPRMPWRGRWEGRSGWGTHVTPWLIHVNVWQNPLKCYGVIILQLIKKKTKNYRDAIAMGPDAITLVLLLLLFCF